MDDVAEAVLKKRSGDGKAEAVRLGEDRKGGTSHSLEEISMIHGTKMAVLASNYIH